MNRLLLIEDDDFAFLEISRLLKGIGYSNEDVVRCSKMTEVMAIKEHDFQIVITDLSLPDSDYGDTFFKVHDKFSYIPVIVLTGFNEIELAIRTIQNGAQDYLVKGDFDQKMLGKAIHYAIERKKVAKETENILQSITDGFFTLNNDWEFTYVNKECSRIFRRTTQELIGTCIWDIFPQLKELKFYTEYHRAKKENISVHFIEQYKPTDLWVSVNAYPTNEGLTVYFMDVTVQRNHLEMIEQQNKRLKEIAWIQSHEVRGPVANILGVVQLFNTENMADPENKTMFELIKEAAYNLDEITRRITAHTFIEKQ